MKCLLQRLALCAAMAPMLAAPFASAPLQAHRGASGIVKQRMVLMEEMGDAMKALTLMVKGRRDWDPVRARALSETISAKAGDHMTRLFPEQEIRSPSEALPLIWQDWESFRGAGGTAEKHSPQR